jgi:DNA-binding CsgD family transcriptional regulator
MLRVARRVLISPAMTNAAVAIPSTSLSDASIFDGLSVPMLVVDAAGRVLTSNAAASAVLEAGRGLTLHEGAVRCTAPGKQRALLGLLAAACAPDMARAAGMLSLGALCGRASPVVVALPARGHALLVLIDPARDKTAIEPHLLEALFGLTPAEARVVGHLATGLALEQVCALLGISVATGRTHLRHVFDKTGTERQGELISLVLSSLGWPSVFLGLLSPPAAP